MDLIARGRARFAGARLIARAPLTCRFDPAVGRQANTATKKRQWIRPTMSPAYEGFAARLFIRRNLGNLRALKAKTRHQAILIEKEHIDVILE